MNEICSIKTSNFELMQETYKIISTTLVVNGYCVFNIEKCKANRICRFYFTSSRLNNLLLPMGILIVFLQLGTVLSNIVQYTRASACYNTYSRTKQNNYLTCTMFKVGVEINREKKSLRHKDSFLYLCVCFLFLPSLHY